MTKTKPKKIPRGYVCAIKAKSTTSNVWMPERCAVLLDGAPIGVYLEIGGFTIESTFLEAADRLHRDDHYAWPLKRLERALPKLKQQWREEYGSGWKLEIHEI